MLPGPLAPLDPHKTRALTTIYAPRKLHTRKNKTAQLRMLDNDIQIKPTLSPFHPLPAIGQKLEKSKTKVIVFDLNKNDSGSLDRSVKIRDVLKPLTPLRIHGFARKNSLGQLDVKRPQQLLRENTYDVIEPIYVTAAANAKVSKDDMSITKTRQLVQPAPTSERTVIEEKIKVSPKTRFKKAALQVAKLSTMPETGKLLCLRERQTYQVCRVEGDKTVCKLQELPQSPAHKLDKLSEIFQSLEMKGRHRDRMKKENSWF
ncbi:hypothetical protein SFRURICE_002234 [Spodoptera frugiperda]|uniref:SFRICE_041617 n=1 Tax=Spodoptera frugiperda TaxID=7108 RepID=A0A2H1X481_SPOFR|nr:hypothetical protein SFRURICE_002234 [Spodoptera frugiperda]